MAKIDYLHRLLFEVYAVNLSNKSLGSPPSILMKFAILDCIISTEYIPPKPPKA
ncbi:TPA: hypothetical protein SBF08_001838 [Campylobacter jejuni]|nr:hypothetical protein [Campylobacter jejuni]